MTTAEHQERVCVRQHFRRHTPLPLQALSLSHAAVFGLSTASSYVCVFRPDRMADDVRVSVCTRPFGLMWPLCRLSCSFVRQNQRTQVIRANPSPPGLVQPVRLETAASSSRAALIRDAPRKTFHLTDPEV